MGERRDTNEREGKQRRESSSHGLSDLAARSTGGALHPIGKAVPCPLLPPLMGAQVGTLSESLKRVQNFNSNGHLREVPPPPRFVMHRGVSTMITPGSYITQIRLLGACSFLPCGGLGDAFMMLTLPVPPCLKATTTTMAMHTRLLAWLALFGEAFLPEPEIFHRRGSVFLPKVRASLLKGIGHLGGWKENWKIWGVRGVVRGLWFSLSSFLEQQLCPPRDHDCLLLPPHRRQ